MPHVNRLTDLQKFRLHADAAVVLSNDLGFALTAAHIKTAEDVVGFALKPPRQPAVADAIALAVEKNAATLHGHFERLVALEAAVEAIQANLIETRKHIDAVRRELASNRSTLNPPARPHLRQGPAFQPERRGPDRDDTHPEPTDNA
jgi:hypothetical protein